MPIKSLHECDSVYYTIVKDLDNICSTITTSSEMKIYEKQARKIIDDAIELYIESEKAEIYKTHYREISNLAKKIDNFQDDINSLHEKIEKLDKGYSYGIIQNMLSSFLFMLVPVVLFAAFFTYKMGWDDMIKAIDRFPQVVAMVKDGASDPKPPKR